MGEQGTAQGKARLAGAGKEHRYTILICGRCGIQLTDVENFEGGDDGPGHPQPYCFDSAQDEAPLFEDVEIEVEPRG